MNIPAQFEEMFGAELWHELVNRSTYVRLKAGESLLQPGAEVTAVPLVLSGLLKVSRMDEDGRELFLYHLGAAETCAMTFTCCMDRHSSEVLVVAEEDCELRAVPMEAMGEWLVKYPAWKSFVMRTVRERFNELLRTLDLVAFKGLDFRLTTYLKDHALTSGTPFVNYSHERIAADLGTSRVVVSRLLKTLERDGKVLLFRGQIKLLDKF